MFEASFAPGYIPTQLIACFKASAATPFVQGTRVQCHTILCCTSISMCEVGSTVVIATCSSSTGTLVGVVVQW